MKQKCIYLAEEDIKLLTEIKGRYGLKSDGQAVAFLLHKHETENKELAVAVRKELEENYLPKERIRWGVQTAEQNTIVMVDALNTLLWMLKAKECYRADEIIHPVIKESQEELKRKIAYFKQKSDERKSRKGNQDSQGSRMTPKGRS